MAPLTITQATKSYGALTVLHGIDVDIADGEFVVLVGPSGCGKSTLLRLIAGLEDISGGTIVIGDRDVTNLHPKDRDIALVFQSYALYPHMTVAENMGFSLRMKNVPKADNDLPPFRNARRHRKFQPCAALRYESRSGFLHRTRDQVHRR